MIRVQSLVICLAMMIVFIHSYQEKRLSETILWSIAGLATGLVVIPIYNMIQARRQR